MKPFLRIGEVSNPKSEFSQVIDFLKENMGKIQGYSLGGIHRWSPEAFSFEFHNDTLSGIVLGKRWEDSVKPFLRIGEVNNPKDEFPHIIDFLKENMGKIQGYSLGGIHRWSPEAFSFEFHNNTLSDIVLEKRWENVYALPLLKVGVYL